MKISPIDIQQQQFKSRPFGYDKSGVDNFLELLAEELERLIRKNQDLQEELARANASLAEMRNREETLKQTLMTTQKVTEELKATARREVDVMMAEAESKSERLVQSAEDRRLQIVEEIQEIKRQKVDFEVSLRSLLEKHIRMLDLDATAIEKHHADRPLLEEPLLFEADESPERDDSHEWPEGEKKEPTQEAFSGEDPGPGSHEGSSNTAGPEKGDLE